MRSGTSAPGLSHDGAGPHDATRASSPGDDLVVLAADQEVRAGPDRCPAYARQGELADPVWQPSSSRHALRRRLLFVRTARPFHHGGRPVLVPFGGDEHEWAAVEVAAWFAGTAGAELRLLGRAPIPRAAAAMRAGCSPTPRSGYSAAAAGVADRALLVDPAGGRRDRGGRRREPRGARPRTATGGGPGVDPRAARRLRAGPAAGPGGAAGAAGRARAREG